MLLCTVLISFGCRTRLWVDEKNVGEIESSFKVLFFEICPQFPVFKSSWRPQSFLCVLGLYLMTMKASRIQLLAAPAFCYIECLCGYCDAPGEI